MAVADLGGGGVGWGREGNSFSFMQFLGKYGKIVCWRPSWGVGQSAKN